jgi:hypothetical protein
VLFSYRFLFNPQIVIESSKETLSQCPERWSLKDGLCVPSYTTKCIAFDPGTITTFQAACNLAKSCGTDWSGLCL